MILMENLLRKILIQQHMKAEKIFIVWFVESLFAKLKIMQIFINQKIKTTAV